MAAGLKANHIGARTSFKGLTRRVAVIANEMLITAWSSAPDGNGDDFGKNSPWN